MGWLAFGSVVLALFAGCGSKHPVPVVPSETSSFDPAAVSAALAAADRDIEDRTLDAGRKADSLLGFYKISPGQRVAELAAGRGYTAELLARIVGEKGVVYGQNPKFVLEKFAEAPWSLRLKKPVMKHVVRVDREMDDPLPADAKDLDVVLLVLFYHDTVWLKTDRAKMNRAVFAALKPGGVFGVVDHQARPGKGVSEAQSLHRIEESAVIAEVTGAGFQLKSHADFLRNKDDPMDWNASPSTAAERRGTSDRFVLSFVKPASEKH